MIPANRGRRARRVALSLAAALALLLLPLVAGCAGRETPEASKRHGMSSDAHSQTRPDAVRTVHAHLDWRIDFDRRAIEGSVTWTVERRDESAPLLLDTREMEITGVAVVRDDGESPAAWRFRPEHAVFGRPLEIDLPPGCERVKVSYRTEPGADGLQWLSPEQTTEGNHPFLYSQAQAILARTFLPCQDTPGVRVTFTADIRTPPGVRAVMAAEPISSDEAAGRWSFQMPQAIPSYLVAFAVGELSFRELGPRTGIYAEPSLAEKAAWEFAETGKMMEAAEALYGPYQWGRYDILVLPPSFPFGGMENPRLTFATPTILAGDRSLVSLVAHELAHSWSGNLVTNATWSDFWLNEGFTVYFERRIMETVYGPERAEMEAVLGRQDLLDDLEELPEGDTILKVDLEGRDPDDAFSNVPYEKGYLFLRLIEKKVGRERFDPFLAKWFDTHSFASRTTEDFVAYLESDLLGAAGVAELDTRQWLYSPGLPENAPRAASDAFARVEDLARRFSAGELTPAELPVADWTTHEWLHFLESLPEEVSLERLGALDAAFDLTHRGNSEILMKWLLLATNRGYSPAEGAVADFLSRQGRRKFLKPLYQALARTPEGRARARAIYARAKPMYHAIAARTIEEILEKDGD